MTRHEIIEKLENSSAEIRAFGVDKLFVFGSVLRDDFNDENDVDFLVDFLPNQKNSLNFLGLYVHFEDTFKRKIDLLTRNSINQNRRNNILETIKQINL